MKNVVFMGTPDFAVPCFCRLADSAIHVQAVFTQPDKPSGRKYKLTPPPVKKKALEYAIPVYQPRSLRVDNEEILELLRELQPDCIVVAAYGQILPKEILELPQYGCVNVHASLLPKYRGAAPIQQCILDGEIQTGVTMMQMAVGLDTGDILTQSALSIGEDESADELHDRLAQLGADMILPTLEAIEQGTVTPLVQDDSQSSYAGMITKDMSALNFEKSAMELSRVVRAITGFTTCEGKRFKIYKAKPIESRSTAEYGEVISCDPLCVQCGQGTALQLEEVQLEGGKRLAVGDFLRGKTMERGMRFGN